MEGYTAEDVDTYNERDAEQYCECLSLSFHKHNNLLRVAWQGDDACKTGVEGSALFGILYERDPDQYHAKLASSLCISDMSLRGAERLEDARLVARKQFALFDQLWNTELDSSVLGYIRPHYGIPPQRPEDRGD